MCVPATNGVTVQYTIASLLASLGSAFFDNSFTSWIIEVLPHEAEYVRVNAYLSFARILGALPTAVVVFFAGSDPQETLTLILWVFLPPNIIFTALLMYRVPVPLLEKAPVQLGIVPSVRQCFRSKEFNRLFSNFLLTGIAMSSTVAALGTYYVLLFFLLDGLSLSLSLLSMFCCLLAFSDTT